MPTSLVSTGVQFPDSTIQTTAATAGGTVTATASGSISNGAAVIINSNGTVSSVSLTAGSYVQGPQFESVAFPVTSAGVRIVNVYQANDGTFIACGLVGSNVYVFSFVLSGDTVTYGSSIISAGQGFEGTRCASMAFNPTLNQAVAFFDDGNSKVRYATVSLVSSNSLSLVSSGQDIVTGQSPIQGIAATFDPFTSLYTIVWRNSSAAELRAAVGTFNVSTGIFSGTAQTTLASVSGSGGSGWVGVTSDPSNGKVFYFVQGAANRLYAVAAQLPSSGTTLTNISTLQTISTDDMNGAAFSVVFDTTTGYVLPSWFSSSLNNARYGALSVSGYTLTLGTIASQGNSNSSLPSLYIRNPVGNTLLIWQVNGSLVGQFYAVTLSGTNVTLGSAITPSITNTYNRPCVDNAFSRFVLVGEGSSAGRARACTYGNAVTTLSATNFLGFSDASYTNGQTATIKVIGSTKGGFSGLTPGLEYSVTPGGTLTTILTSAYGGLALNSTTLLVKG